MLPITAHYTLTFDEFAEAYRLQRRYSRFLTGPTPRSRWFGCLAMAGLFILLFIATAIATYATGHRTVTPTGRPHIESDSPIVTFLIGCLPWPILVGFLWLVIGRFPVERRLLRGVSVVFLLIGASVSLTSTFFTPQTPADVGGNSSNLFTAFLPMLVALIGFLFIVRGILRRGIHVAWEGQPVVRQPVHLEATNDRVVYSTALSRSEYAWPAYVSFSETSNLFVLFPSALTFQVIPKRGFAGPEQLQAFHDLLASRLRTADASPQRFPVLPVLPLAVAPLTERE